MTVSKCGNKLCLGNSLNIFTQDLLRSVFKAFQKFLRVNFFLLLGKRSKLLTIKMICDGLGITLGEFFSTPEFDGIEQEIK